MIRNQDHVLVQSKLASRYWQSHQIHRYHDLHEKHSPDFGVLEYGLPPVEVELCTVVSFVR